MSTSQMPDYDDYSVAELRDGLAHVDRELYPERARAMEEALARREQARLEREVAEQEAADHEETERAALLGTPARRRGTAWGRWLLGLAALLLLGVAGVAVGLGTGLVPLPLAGEALEELRAFARVAERHTPDGTQIKAYETWHPGENGHCYSLHLTHEAWPSPPTEEQARDLARRAVAALDPARERARVRIIYQKAGRWTFPLSELREAGEGEDGLR